MNIEKSKSLVAHFKRSASHQESLSESHEKMYAAHAAHADHHEDMVDETDGHEKAHHKASMAFHKAMAGHHEGLRKAHSALAAHLAAMAEGFDDGHAGKVLAAIGLGAEPEENLLAAVYPEGIKTFAVPRAAGKINADGLDPALRDLVGLE